jgi:hypothetical protein
LALDLDPAAAGELGNRLDATCVRARHDPVDGVRGGRDRKRPRVRSSDAIELAGTVLDG